MDHYSITHIIGIDEAGRGPLAGPVAVGVAMVPLAFDWDSIPGVADSKKVSESVRNAIYERAVLLQECGALDFAVTLVSERIIDRRGITAAVAAGIRKALTELDPNPDSVAIKLDGLLVAPPHFHNQTTIIKGDATEKVIGLASILAKVTRDRYMTRLAMRFPQYEFHVHKGYGTVRHRDYIQQYGLSPVHRKTFCKKLIERNNVV